MNKLVAKLIFSCFILMTLIGGIVYVQDMQNHGSEHKIQVMDLGPLWS